MRALFITATLFFASIGAAAVYFAVSDSGHEYDLKLVLPIDTRQMPDIPPAPGIAGASEPQAAPVTAGVAETPESLREAEAIVGTNSFRFEGDKPGADAAAGQE